MSSSKASPPGGPAARPFPQETSCTFPELFNSTLSLSIWVLFEKIASGLSQRLAHMCVFMLSWVPVFVTPMDSRPPGSSVHRILQARIMEWVAILSSRGSSWPRDRDPHLLCLLHWEVGSLPLVPPRKPCLAHKGAQNKWRNGLLRHDGFSNKLHASKNFQIETSAARLSWSGADLRSCWALKVRVRRWGPWLGRLCAPVSVVLWISVDRIYPGNSRLSLNISLKNEWTILQPFVVNYYVAGENPSVFSFPVCTMGRIMVFSLGCYKD